MKSWRSSCAPWWSKWKKNYMEKSYFYKQQQNLYMRTKSVPEKDCRKKKSLKQMWVKKKNRKKAENDDDDKNKSLKVYFSTTANTHKYILYYATTELTAPLCYDNSVCVFIKFYPSFSHICCTPSLDSPSLEEGRSICWVSSPCTPPGHMLGSGV